MATPRKKLPDHITWAVELIEEHQARITHLLKDVEKIRTDRRGLNKHALEADLAKISESNTIIGQALASIERRDPQPDGNGAKPAVDLTWLTAMGKLAETERAELVQAFITAKMAEFER